MIPSKKYAILFRLQSALVCVCIIVSIHIYKGIISVASNAENGSFLEVSPIGSDDPLAWLVGNYLPILITPVILMMVVLGSGKIAKAMAGNS